MSDNLAVEGDIPDDDQHLQRADGTIVAIQEGYKIGHRAGHANVHGDQRHMIGEIAGPTTFDRMAIVTGATYNPLTDRTRVAYRYVDEIAGVL